MEDVITAPAEIDVTNCDMLAAALRVSGRDDVVLDCSAIRFIDSSGLRVLVEARNRLRRQGRQLVLMAPSAILVRLLQITDMTDLFTLRP